MKRNRLWVLTLTAFIFLAVITYIAVVIYIPGQQQDQSETQSGLMTRNTQPATEIHTSQNNARFLTLVAVMVAGIICSYIFEVAKKSAPTINLLAELGKMLTNPRLIMALVVSPIIFNSIYIAIGDNPQNIGDYLLAFQNGFFWEAILSSLSRRN